VVIPDDKKMNIAYLILAHQHPEQLSRLVRQLQTPAADMFVHVDAKVNIGPFMRAVGSHVKFTEKRIPVYWADYSQVDAVLLLIETALAVPRNYDYFVLLSGVDYPLRSAAEIEDFFLRNKGLEFINWVAMPSTLVAKPLSRLTDYKRRPGLLGWIIGRVRQLLAKLHVIPRERDYRVYLGNLAPYGGSTWWALTRDACDYIQKFAVGNPRLMRFFENTSSPDEMVFQTILANSPFRSSMRRNITYTDWSKGGNSPSPIRDQHVAMFRANPIVRAEEGAYVAGEFLFCRKVMDAATSDQLAVMIQQRDAVT
jgi:hypothetical protein